MIEGFATALDPTNIMLLFVGVTLGTIFGMFPGLGAPTAIALLLPISFGLDPTTALIMLAGIYYGAMYGNTITAVLLNIPGDSAAVVTALEGNKLARSGSGGQALSVAAVASFIGGTVGIVAFTFFAPLLAGWALRFGPPEYFALMVFAFATLPAFSEAGAPRVGISVALGLLVASVGMDLYSGRSRFTFGQAPLLSGIGFVPAIIGLFGIGDVLASAAHTERRDLEVDRFSLRELIPSRANMVRSRAAIGRGTLLGFGIGVLPGAGATIASFMSYAWERSRAKAGHLFGKGAIEGVAGPESANNAAVMGSFVPLLTLGVPGSGATAVLLGGFLIWGIQPGPGLFQGDNSDLVWGLMASMYLGNIMLLAMSVLLIPVFTRILRVPYEVLLPAIVVFCAIGAYGTRANLADVWIMFGMGGLGLLMRRTGIPIAPMILALVLGPIMEAALRQSLTISRGEMSIFVTRPISATLLAVAAVALVFGIGRKQVVSLPQDVDESTDETV